MLTVCHLYPDLLNLYGDRGNVTVFLRRCQWRGIPVRLWEVRFGESVDFTKVDFLFLGGGSDREQQLVVTDLLPRLANLRQAIEEGLVVLAVCGGYQLLGHYYQTAQGEKLPGLGILDLYTEAGEGRLIGDIAVEVQMGGRSQILCGFENHSGRTYLGRVSPLGRVLRGFGNNGWDGTEGARYKNVFGTYLHGPLLPKNPAFADYLISLALGRRGLEIMLPPLPDVLERQAREVILRRLRLRGS
ncbi:CobB/CobQ domain protein glutamine amidotransferase [Ammonifex degensii KC4]|uniref:Lipid II isoglutaminyl synthase (glutamine-hydrolyzing) subunit GatD n=1 Tax=Ammonifex degensii (strain DSM 10501 / KC4) TaxID=429009 RepID=C9RBG9_AMMDK|nr:glutamine amidotransferase [Ammonifex degensii]ACX51596.1 CobB/CobQ domain protein glutamine amidotransferase [Ammonifex degensii KC4]